jgi:hypothetical protein
VAGGRCPHHHPRPAHREGRLRPQLRRHPELLPAARDRYFFNT